MSKYKGFDTVELVKPKKSYFDLSATKRTTTRAGRMTPVFITECIPSDVFNGSSEILLRMAPLLAPIYDNIKLYVHYWFVPNRLLWDEWETFITGGRLGVGIDPTTAPVPPFVDLGLVGGAAPVTKSSLADYLGLPIFEDLPGFTNWASYTGKNIDIMPFLAYQLIWFEYYRDRNFVDDDQAVTWGVTIPAPSGDAGLPLGIFDLKQRAWSADYFTSALPFTQRGEEVLMPVSLGGVAQLKVDPLGSETSAVLSGISQPGSIAVGYGIDIDPETGVNNGDLYVKGEDFGGTTTSINDFRTAYALQVWYERNAIGGSRYTESTQAHFGVRPQDSRLQRPEYIGGGVIPIKISEVVSTAYSNDGTDVVPLANLAGHGITYGNTNHFNYFCVEHGFIIGIASIMSDGSYHQGVPRMFRRRSFLDYPWPTFAKLGEQTVDKAELFGSAVNLTEDADGNLPLFGYQSRYADWKYIPNTNHGEFHDTLLFWTLTRDFASAPELGETFVTYDSTVQDRIFAVNGGDDNFWLYVYNKVGVKRPLPYFGTPNTLGFV
ncbi:MAG: major capsid protein [Microviridae sp.]|nr:MAG: major capsid protein [Microviridae sp.]